MYLAQENSLPHLDHFLKKIESKPDSWRLISIEFQSNDLLNSKLFENLCAKSLVASFEQTECHIFWVKPEFILIYFQGRALPIEKCVEEFFRNTEFKGFGRFFDILDLSIHWETMIGVIERITKNFEERKPPSYSGTAGISQSAPHHSQDNEQSGLILDLSKDRIKQMFSVRSHRSRPLILLVEDDPFTQQLVKLAIKDSFEVISAETALQAIAYYQRHLPDLVFLDIQLPDGNGISLLNKIAAADPNHYTVMLSSHTQKEKIIECQGFGAKGFIGKPFTRQRLVDALEKFRSAKNKASVLGGIHGA
ncbi:MAG: response regulator [Pseudobdellovibrionaceae bacterium]|jgi:CheY-like chemotaxis protein|nr:response regulator [Pseudobdellovibrionaceae bacterium]